VERIRKCADRPLQRRATRPGAFTNLVVAMPPNSLATFLAECGYVPLGVPLIKRILAFPGQTVCSKRARHWC
jgi:type IV secretory pathway protease TraF